MSRMIVLHIGVYKDDMVLWGEASESDRTRTHQVTQVHKAKPYPFSANLSGITRSLKEAIPNVKIPTTRACDVVAWLPTKDTSPIPSSGVIADIPTFGTKTQIVPWHIRAFKIAIHEAVDILRVSVGKRMLVPGLMVGDDISYWADALRMAGSLIARQQFLPGLIKDGLRYKAEWNPVFAGRDAQTISDMATRMPGVARAIYEHDMERQPKASPAAILRKTVAAFVDGMVRSAIWRILPPASRKRKKFDSVHDSWLHALGSPNGILAGNKDDMSQLADNIYDWQRSILMSVKSPFRLCFRLEEPQSMSGDTKASDNIWNIRYLMQSREDPSLLVPAKKIWDGNTQTIEQSGPNAKEFLLLSLGQASGICPGVAAGLQSSDMTGYKINFAQAYEFLIRDAVALEQAGYGIMLPAWWTGKGTKAKLTARAKMKTPKMQGGGGLNLDSIMRFEWEISLGDQNMTVDELEQLARLKSPLVQARGQWVELNAEEIQSAIKFLKKGQTRASFRDVLQMELGADMIPGGLDFGGIKADGHIADVLKRLNGTKEFQDMKPPKGFTGKLRPYQVRGYSWLWFLRQYGLGGCLADDMGLGKTIQTLALIQNHWRAGDKPTLLVCPTSVINNWQKEAARFTPELPVMIHHGTDRKKGANFQRAAKKHAMVVSSYGLARQDTDSFKKVSWSGVIVDEAQNIKNADTAQARAVRSLNADYRFALTGTPVENNVGDLWSIMEFLNPGFLGTQASFKRNFFTPIQMDHDRTATDTLRRATAPFILRRLKTDKSIISDLPEKMEMKVFCSLTKEQASLYAATLEDIDRSLSISEGIQKRGIILGALSKLKQVCNHPAHFLGDNSAIPNRSGKLTRLTEMLEEVVEIGDKALVFSQFVEMGRIIQRHLQETLGREVLFLHGGIPKKRRDAMVERFQSERAGPSIFVISLKAGGTGLNLTMANHVFHFDRWWNPAVEDQATDRVFRIGQTQNVQVHKFICAGTLEERIDKIIENKKSVADTIVGTGEGWLTKLNDDDLREVLALNMEVAGR